MTRGREAPGLDAEMRYRVDSATLEAVDELVPDGVPRSEFMREKTHEIVEDGEEEIPDDLDEKARTGEVVSA
jgi:hypothetical protein